MDSLKLRLTCYSKISAPLLAHRVVVCHEKPYSVAQCVPVHGSHNLVKIEERISRSLVVRVG